MRGQTITGLAAIALAVGFNIPYAALASLYEYPAILRRPAADALDLFAAGGPPLVLAWIGFMLAALAMVPLATALAITPQRLTARPALAVGAAVSGALAGLAQAIGLSRWVFAVPALAEAHLTGSPEARLSAEHAFDLLNAWGGVAIGEHLGQLLTAAFVLQVALLQRAERRTIAGLLGLTTTALLLAGAAEGPAVALGVSGEAFALTTIAGFLALTLWLIATGVGLIRVPRA
ncbi:DUF4386 family protein [Phenylobacterium sp. 20VBR1]|uniref:DUF4386 family protein n=1 Tax=Phenylobacterium glaciei TaxID=2803784 RepID=A0A941HXF9_9CAUL|nr:DUF4386 family protein [Phenylobacterium glaciei]MBR7621046.1 DUF4386 family protein [Phenylobacterium glaciei]